MRNPILEGEDKNLNPEDKLIEKALRPKMLDEFSGQQK